MCVCVPFGKEEQPNQCKPEPNVLKILPIIPSSTSQKNTYSYFILISLPIIPILFFSINASGMYWHLEKQADLILC